MKPYNTDLTIHPLPAGSFTSTSFIKEFQSPGTGNRPRMRWWVPSVLLSREGIERDIRSIAEAGFGGVEVVPMPRLEPPADFTIEWGTSRWKELNRIMLEAASNCNITLDFTMTPFWPLALPGITDASDPAQGTQMELDAAFVDGITRTRPFCGILPMSEEALLDAESVNALPRLAAVTYACYTDKSAKTLSLSSAGCLNITTDVISDPGDPLIRRTCFKPENEGEYVLFAWWEHPSGERTCQNLQLDHYSVAATKRLIDTWEQELLPSYGKYARTICAMFIDSLEYQTHLDWTDGFLSRFKEQNSYDFTPFLPAVYERDSPGTFVSFPKPDFRFDLNNEQLRNDYQEFITQLYVNNHLIPLTEFCERHDMAMRYQTAYGKILDLAQTAMYVSIPETETLYGGDILDFYRLQSGAVHITGRPLYSIEASAEMNGRGGGRQNSGNYQQTWGNQLWHIQRAMACGVNQIVFHGYSYEGFYEGPGNENGFIEGTHWPGYTTMGYDEFSNNWSACQPNWLHVKHYTDFLSRSQYLLRLGTAKTDLAVYHHSYEEVIDFNGAVKVYQDNGLLEQQGFTYDFLSPAALMLDQVTVREGLLCPDGPSYRALLINDEERLPAQVKQKLAGFAADGLPILFIGKQSSTNSYYQESASTEAWHRLLAAPTTVLVSSTAEVPYALNRQGISPRAAFRDPARVLTACRQTDYADFFYFYNYGDADTYYDAQDMAEADLRVTLSGQGTPWLLNVWDGSCSPAADYETDGQSITLPLHLAGNESLFIALVRDEEALGLHRQDVSSARPLPASGILKDGHRTELTNWNLLVEQWSESPVPSESTKTLHTFTALEHACPWTILPEMQYASGIGTYETAFTPDDKQSPSSACYLVLGRICDSFSVCINGIEIPASQTNTTLDITPLIVAGTNTIRITVASTLLNSLLQYTREHGLIDREGLTDPRPLNDYGILNPVYLITYP